MPAGIQIQPRCGTIAVCRIARRCGDAGSELTSRSDRACVRSQPPGLGALGGDGWAKNFDRHCKKRFRRRRVANAGISLRCAEQRIAHDRSTVAALSLEYFERPCVILDRVLIATCRKIDCGQIERACTDSGSLGATVPVSYT